MPGYSWPGSPMMVMITSDYHRDDHHLYGTGTVVRAVDSSHECRHACRKCGPDRDLIEVCGVLLTAMGGYLASCTGFYCTAAQR